MTLETLLNEPGFRALVARFASETPARVDEMRAALEAGDLEEVKAQAHRLKGAGGGYGFDEITSAALVVEHLANAGLTERLPEAIDSLGSVCGAASERWAGEVCV